VEDQRFLGDQVFAESMGGEKDVEVPRPKAKSRIDRDARNLGKYLDIEVSVLRGADRSWAVSKARKQVAYVLVRRMGYRLKDVAGYLGRDAATIATMLSRMNERLAGGIQEKREIERLGKIVDS
jgi:chromosomal replication initiation ATPase DnaA